MKRELTTEQKVHFASASNAIENEFALHCWYHIPEHRPDSPATSVLWSKRHDEISSVHGFGGLIGWDHCVVGWSGGMEENARETAQEAVETYPELKPILEADEHNFYFLGGGMCMHTLASGVIEVAEDGQSAKASFYTPGNIWFNLFPDKKQHGGFVWERYAQDWVFEDNEWRVLHNQVMKDFGSTIDSENVAAGQYKLMCRHGWIWNTMMPGPPVEKDVPGPANMDYWPVIIPQRTLLWPEPYRTLSETTAYIPEPGDGVGEYRIPDLPDNGLPVRGALAEL